MSIDESMVEILDQLQSFITANPTRAFFEPAVDDAAIEAVERTIGLSLPKSYGIFLRRFNGGFINICNFGPDDEHWDLKTARWNSNHLLGTGHLIKAYNMARDIVGWDRIGFIPFCQTWEQESLVFIPTRENPEPPVLDASHESSEWGVLYPDFPTMLRAYVKREGNIETIARS